VSSRIRSLLASLWWLGCSVSSRDVPAPAPEAYDEPRARMVREQLVTRGIRDKRVLEAMGRVPRHELVPEGERDDAYVDGPLPIGEGQTISQPYIVAAMSEAAALAGNERVLEVGTGSGYQAAVLSALAREVYTIELEPVLAARAKRDLERLGCTNVHTRTGDGYRGWPEAAPFDAILVTAAPDHVPPALLDQLAPGGRLVIPVGGSGNQELWLFTKTERGVERRQLMPVRFVPLRGESEKVKER
jgi:protein-L-isoaspartate(D-aspartate) O-methyltransferase